MGLGGTHVSKGRKGVGSKKFPRGCDLSIFGEVVGSVTLLGAFYFLPNLLLLHLVRIFTSLL